MKLKGKKVLITGADGFIGSHLVEALTEEGCHVKAFVYYNSFNSWGWLDTFAPKKLSKLDVIAGDIRDYGSVMTAVKGVDFVFHLAALIGIPFSYYSPESYIDTNVSGTLNILQACRHYKTSRIFTTSTSEVYGTAKYAPIDEKHPLQGQSPYSASKIAADKISESFYRSFELPVVIARPFNTYGPRQSARAVIPTIITQLLSGKRNICLGELSPTRDFNYVKDVCRGFIALAGCDAAVGKEINIGSGQEISIQNLAQMLIELINPKAKIISEYLRKRPVKSEVERLVCDNALIKKLTMWESRVSLKEGLAEAIQWFKVKENLNRYKTNIYNV